MVVRFPRALAGASLALAISACTPTVINHGYRLDTARLDAIRPGVTSREEVRRLLGSPSTVATLDDKTWYYVAQRKERANFYQEKLVDQEVVAIVFDERGLVARVEVNGLHDAQPIEPVADTTPTRGNELTLWEQIVGNIGRFNTPTDPLLRRRGPGPY
ncbi:MAG: outer membrane protein assembly factor BamE [Geminicoccaceae bacterium]|nr:outer membrane protein assembly factor BamE [Geminicoccaceae bacterium]MCS7266870.1 outer membrane protein assembly factor BamE [Geminicoccaceae bacterium]MCX7628866.1 outer membrane protein assembly factor BamE [Geminicoccaceae bacterium]MDW8124207.1 outer membrane protein assembly factor BamE [Geminicoccaceae bacterium]MDW8340570.1 outer membrane protein assembly factor BamE [Geminicoccaceae bacterium]